MASPVHRYLFSPPSSPPAIQGSHSPLLEPLESFHAINRLLSPSPSSFNRHNHGNDSGSSGFLPGPELDVKKQTPTISHQAGPGGFATSTQTYPSRVVSPVPVSASSSSVMVTGYPLPPFPPSSTSSYQPHPQQPATSRRNSFSTPYASLQQQQPTNVPTREYMLPLPSTHRRPSVTVPTSTSVHSGVLSLLVHGRKSVLLGLRARTRTLLVTLVGLACLVLLVRSTTGSILVAPTTTRHQDFERLSVVGGKKVRVTDHHGAPRTLMYSKTAHESHGMAIPPPERVSRPKHHHQAPALTPAQELLALQSYLLASPRHALPPNTRPLEPLDPMTLVGFQAAAADADAEQGWKELERDVEPLVVYSFSQTWTRPVLELLNVYALDPQPVVFSVEGRADAPALTEILARLVPSRSVASEAVITIAGKPINGYAQLEKLHRTGKLHQLLERAGAVVDGLRRKEEGERARRGRLVKRVKQAQIKVVRGDQDGEDEAE